MFKLIIETAVRHRWLVVFMAALIAAVGLFQLGKLPIDAVPDITNRQVQINTVAPALTPEQIERQVTYPLETALAASSNPEEVMMAVRGVQTGTENSSTYFTQP